MARNFQEVKKFLESHYPELAGRIRGENYPIPESAVWASRLLSFFQLFCLAAAFMGDSIFSFIPFVRQPPGWYYTLKENGMAAVIAIFLVIPTLVQRIITTGAFEIILDDSIVIFSKLESGRMPNGNDLLEAMARAGLKAATN